VFGKNREVTFTGRIDGYENRRIGEYDYRFPRV
jgi:outer membrane lipoprotein